MKKTMKRIISLITAMSLWIICMTSTANAETLPKNLLIYVARNSEAKLDGDVSVEFTLENGIYKGCVYLTGIADTSKCFLSWTPSENVLFSDGATVYESGNAPIAPNGGSVTYNVLYDGQTATFVIDTVQGSEDVKGMFISVDESKGTIEAMNSDSDHETSCFGALRVDGNEYIMSIKGRGNATWERCDKKPYNITFYKKNDYDKKQSVSLINGVKAKKWSLLANAADSSLMRNKVGYDLANELGIGLSSSFTDIWLNGKYIGNYLLTPKSDYLASDDGYILELDNYKDNKDPQFTLDGLTEPVAFWGCYTRFTVKNIGDDANTNAEEIRVWMQNLWNCMRDYGSDEYLKYLDLDSWAKMYLLNELYKDYDILAGSILMHRDTLDSGSKLVAGPFWDLDYALGRTGYNIHGSMDKTSQLSADNWYIDNIDTDTDYGFIYSGRFTSWFQELGKHEEFLSRVYELYNEYSEEINGLYDNIERQYNILSASALMNYRIWNVNQNTYNNHRVSSLVTYGSGKYSLKYEKTSDWDSYIRNLKLFVKTRLEFLSDNLTVAKPSGKISGDTDIKVGDNLTLEVKDVSDTDVSYTWQSSFDNTNWSDIKGENAAVYTAKVNFSDDGKYYRCILKKSGKLIETSRVAKVNAVASSLTDTVRLSVKTTLAGDLKADGRIDAQDIAVLSKIILGETVTYDIDIADVYKDGTVNILDIVRLKKILSAII